MGDVAASSTDHPLSTLPWNVDIAMPNLLDIPDKV